MNELKMYDVAAAKYYKTADREVMPLLSWGFYIENHSTIIGFKKDLIVLKEFSDKWNTNVDFLKELTVNNTVVIVTTPELKIVYATHNIKQMNGYEQDEVLGESPKIFQGKNTCLDVSRKIREAVNNELPFDEVLLNYRKDKSVYRCNIKGVPVYSKKGTLVNYIAFEKTTSCF